MSEAQKSTTTVQQIGPIDGPTVCSKCGEKIVNALTTDEQNVYHPHCFVCSNCGQTLAGGFFYKSKNAKINSSRSSSVEATRFCEDCYKKIAPKCARCEKIIEGSSIVWEEKKFHDSCFTCCGIDKNDEPCGQPMKDEPVYPFQDQWFCKSCFDRLENGATAASREILSRKCGKCHKEFQAGGLVSEYKDEFYHPQCFVCCQCNTSIASKSFYQQSKTDDRQTDGKFLCENCHVKNAAECSECKEKIVSGEAIGFEGKQFHRSCFLCQSCGNEIGSAHFFKTKEGKYICQRCSTDQHRTTNF